MFDAATNALIQMFSPPLRALLWRSIGLALMLIVFVGAVLERLIVHLIGAGGASVETTLGPHAHMPVAALAWLLSFAAGFGIIVGSSGYDCGYLYDRWLYTGDYYWKHRYYSCRSGW